MEAVGMVGFSPSTDARSSCRCFCIVDGLFVILWIIGLVARFKNIVYLVIAIGIGIGFYFIHRNLLKTENNNGVSLLFTTVELEGGDDSTGGKHERRF
jgi:hypothetical protein